MGRLLPSADAAGPRSVGPDDYFDLRPLSTERPTAFGPFSIECRRTVHHIPTFAMRVTAGGRSLGLSADTAYDPGLVDWLAEADLVVHETNLGLHTPYEKLVTLPEPVRKKLRLIHYPDDFDLDDGVIEPLRPGRLYVVG
jgi:ribonuclease BN (tRNA processing enzyme)